MASAQCQAGEIKSKKKKTKNKNVLATLLHFWFPDS